MAETISVALPVYNGALYLEQQLNSILEQLEPGDEIVAAYQPSSDNSLEILERYQRSDERVKILHNEMCIRDRPKADPDQMGRGVLPASGMN